MKKGLISVLVVSMAFFAFGCRSAPDAPTGVADVNMPPWINEMAPEDVLWGIGTSNVQLVDMRLRMSEASARQNIAEQIATQAQGMITSWAREAGGVSDASAAVFAETVFRQLTEVTLQGVVPDLRWTAPDGHLWTRVRMTREDASRSVADEIARTIDSEAARFAEWRAMNALEEMDRHLRR